MKEVGVANAGRRRLSVRRPNGWDSLAGGGDSSVQSRSGMTSATDANAEFAVLRADSLEARGTRGRSRYYVSRVRHYGGLLKRSLHPRFVLANALSGVLPDFVSGAVRARMYRWAGFDIADHVTINLDDKVSIGNNVAIAPQVLIYTGSHKIGPGSMRMGDFMSAPVTIEDGAWIRLGAIIVPGVTIGRGSVIAAGAVVLKDVPPNTYVEGNPAQVVRRLPWGYR